MGKLPHLSPGHPQSSQEVRSIYVSEDVMHMRLPPPFLNSKPSVASLRSLGRTFKRSQ